MDILLQCVMAIVTITTIAALFIVIRWPWQDSLDGLIKLRERVARIEGKIPKAYCENCRYAKQFGIGAGITYGCQCPKYTKASSSERNQAASCYINNSDNLCPEFIKSCPPIKR